MNNDSLSEKNSRKRDRSDSEEDGANFDRPTKICTKEVIERPTLKKNDFYSGSTSPKKKSLSLKLPEEDLQKLEESYKKDICPCNYFNELVEKFGKYIESPMFQCHIHQ